MRRSRRSNVTRPLTLLVLVALAGGCQLTPRDFARSDPPQLLQVSLRSGEEQDPTEPIRLTFSRPLDPAGLSLSSVVVLPYAELAECIDDAACAGDPCVAGHCQRDPLNHAWLADMANPPLSRPRLAQAAPAALRLEGETRLVWDPVAPLAPHRLHALLVGPGLVAADGTPVALAAGSRLVLQEAFTTGPAELGRPLLTMASPLDGAIEVPVNLARVLVLFSRPVLGVEPESLFLRLSDGRRVAATLEINPPRCAPRALGTCFELRLGETLPPRQRIELAATAAVRDLRGRPVLTGRPPVFSTAPAPDSHPPVGTVRVRVSDRCAVVRAGADERTDLRLRPLWGAAERWSVGAAHHEMALPAPLGSPGILVIDLEDVAGNCADPVAAPVERGDLGPRVAITEVLAHPAGPEPAQEFVELLNFDEAPANLEGWSITDENGQPAANAMPAVTLQPGQLAVVVGPTFNEALQDPPIAPDAVLVRLRRAIASHGLVNSGAPLLLRDSAGRVVSSYSGVLPGALKKGCSIERVAPDACDIAASWRLEPRGASTPGRLPEGASPSGAQP
jgi:hypothetical protein